MTVFRFGLISRIALLVIGIEIAAFSTLGWFYTDRFSTVAEERVRSRLRLIGQMIARNELAVSSIAGKELVSDLVGAPYLDGVIIGGSGRVIVASNPAYLGRQARDIPDFDLGWLAESAPDEQIVARQDTLTSISHIQASGSGAPIYYTALTISTTELNSQKRSITLWGHVGAMLFILLTSASIIVLAQRLITRRLDASLKVLKRVENGDLGARIAVWSDDELGQLQKGINSMTSKVGALLNQHRRNEEEISTILDAIADGVIAVGPDGTVLRCNPSAATILGDGHGDAVTGPIATLLPEVSLPTEPPWWAVPETLTAHGRIEFERLRPDAPPRSIELSHGPIREPDGTVVGAVLVLQDVTARKRTETKLREAVERLTASNSELERFAYVASHDLQEPLRTITSFTQLLDRQLGDSLAQDDRELFAFIVAAAKRMSMLINDLLAYSRVNTRGIQFSPVALQRACAVALDNLHETITASQAEIIVGDLPNVVGDRIQLMQVFQNLIGNSIKFRRPDALPQVRVSAEQIGGEWVISVADNGIGIADTDQDIFEIFRRLHTASSYPGSGVGLAICKRIVERHHGRLWFDRLPGEGTAFHFTLPVPA